MEYEVKKGDGWYRIAKNLGVNVNDLLQANNAKLDTMLQPGLKLKTSKVAELPSTTNQWQVVAGLNDAVANWAKLRVDTTMNNVNQALAEQEANEQKIQRKASIGTKGVVQQQAKADTIRLLQALLKEGYDLGRWGADGNWGNATNAAIAQAEKDGWIINNNSLVKGPNYKPRPTLNLNRGKQSNKVLSSRKAVINGLVIDECARFGNCNMRDEGYIANGDAWTRHNNQKTIYSGFNTDERPNTYNRDYVVNYNLNAADNVASNFDINTLDKDSMYSVGMYYMGSPSLEKAYNEGSNGATNTHTGNLIFDKNLNDWIVKHNVHGTEITNKYSDVLGSKGKYGITGVYLPYKNNILGKIASFITGLI